VAVTDRFFAGLLLAALGSFLGASSGCAPARTREGTPPETQAGPGRLQSSQCPRSGPSLPQDCPKLLPPTSRTAEERELDAAAWVVRKHAFDQERLALDYRRGSARHALELERDGAGEKRSAEAPDPEMAEAESEESALLDTRAKEIGERERCGGKPAGEIVVLVPLSEAQPVVKLVHAAVVAYDGNGPGQGESVVARVGCEWKPVSLPDTGSFATALRTPSGEWVFTGIVKKEQCSATFTVSRLHEGRSEVLFAEEGDSGPEGVCTPRTQLEWEVDGGVLFGVRRLVRNPERGDYSLVARYRWTKGKLVYEPAP
jgi:hypothetical protein